MEMKFFGGPYDGREIDEAVLEQHASTLPVHGDLGARVFILMPPPETWERLVRGDEANPGPVFPYERVSDPEGPRFEWSSFGGLSQALLEARLRVHPRASTALSALSDGTRQVIVGIVAGLQKTAPESWPEQKVFRVTDDKPIYLVHLPDSLRAFVRVLETGELELFDIVQEDTLRLFRERYAAVSHPG